jgi:4-amino-4-deoxy-L-arabinose transferase-like glycosyltransferase
MRSSPKNEVLTVLVLLIILYGGAFLRLEKIFYSPGWFRDEGTYFEVTRSLLDGRARLGALNITFASPFMTHPPLYFYCAAAWLKLFHDDFQQFRAFNAWLGIATIFFVFLIGTQAANKYCGLLAAAIFAVHPVVVQFNRMAFPYNLYMLFASIVAYFTLAYFRADESRKRVYLALAVVAAALAMLTVYYALSLVIFLLLAVILHRRTKDIPLTIACLLPLALFLLYSALAPVTGFAEDFAALRRSARAGSPFATLRHYLEFFQLGPFVVLGAIGLALIPERRARWTLFALLFLIMHPVLRKADTIIRFVNYPIIPVLPLLAVGLAAFCFSVMNAVGRFLAQDIAERFPRFFPGDRERSLLSAILRGLVLLGAVAILYLFWHTDLQSIYGKFETPLEFAMVQNVEDAQRAARFINNHSTQSDLVLATSTLSWLVKAKSADIAQALLRDGKKTDFYLYDISPQRFMFDPSLGKAKFVVEDHFTDQRMNISPGVPHYEIRKALEYVRQNWQMVFRSGEYRVYLNPHYQL